MKLLSILKRRNLGLFLRNRASLFLAPPGHYYSPIPDQDFLVENSNKLFDRSNTDVKGIQLNRSSQLLMLQEFSGFYKDQPFAEKQHDAGRYYFDNSVFRHADAIILYCFLRYLRPKTVIEVGSGFSSAVMLDTKDEAPDLDTQFHFIEPHAERLRKLLRRQDQETCTIYEKPVQEIQRELFSRLNKNDILFIDSSHVAKCGSDVNCLMFEILPVLNPGVYVHFHDVFWPFEYPREWLLLGRAWNEDYFLRAFLQYNSRFEIVFFNSYLGHTAIEQVRQNMPLFLKDTGGSIWLRVREDSSSGST